jgi:hypothetical protein
VRGESDEVTIISNANAIRDPGAMMVLQTKYQKLDTIVDQCTLIDAFSIERKVPPWVLC